MLCDVYYAWEMIILSAKYRRIKFLSYESKHATAVAAAASEWPLAFAEANPKGFQFTQILEFVDYK